MHRVALRFFSVLLISVTGLLFSVAPALAIVTPVQTIAPGCHTITAAESAALKEAGAEIPSNGQFCDKDKTLLYGACPESPYAYLETKKVRSGIDVAHFNADYACRLSKFLKAADAAGMKIMITSGYRSIAQQASLYANRRPGVPVAPPGRSRHNYGIAADLTFDGKWPSFGLGNANVTRCVQTLPSCKWAHDNETTFGLKYPMLVEPWHIEPGTGVKGMEQLPSDPNYWSSDGGTTYSGAPISSYQTLPPPAMVSSITPSTIANPTTAPTTPSQTQTQPQICTPDFSCSNNTMYYKTTSCTTQVYQICPYGCNGNSCNLSTSTAATASTNISTVLTGTSTGNTNTNTNSNTNTDDTGTPTQSVSDILNSFANPTTVEIGTSSPIAFVLNPDTGEVEQLSQNTGGTTLRPASNTITSIQPTAGQQTFTSTDLSGSPGSFNGATQTSGLGLVLQNMKNALLWALNALRGLTHLSAN